jgi:4-hydroxy-4-methyl-2-oxoglutarate aldolase
MLNDVIQLIQDLELSSTQVADALGKTGGIGGLRVLSFNKRIVGKVELVYVYGKSNYYLHKSIQNIERDSIVIVVPIECDDLAIFGELVTRYLFEVKGVIGLVVLGNIRDLDEIEILNYPVWFYGSNPIGCNNIKPVKSLNEVKHEEYKFIHNSIAVLDKTGITLIEEKSISIEIVNQLKAIKVKEISWEKEIFDNFKSTFQVICEPYDS